MSVASRAEEENLGYPSMPDHALDDREFKILRSATSAFRRRDELEKALREEAAAGWVLLQKLDDARLRLQRPRAARAGDGKGAIDPYRSYYGMGPGAAVLVAMAIVIPLLGLLILGTFLLSATR